MSTTLRLGVLIAAVVFSLASSNQNRQARQPAPPPSVGGGSGAPQPVPMDPELALGLWKSSFGPVKVERDETSPNHLMGVWVYERGGAEIIGFFRGAVSGNVLSFRWEEPTTSGPPLRGGGYLVFDQRGRTFAGKWWTANRDRGGDWNGWRGEAQVPEGATPRAPKSGPAEQAPPEPAEPPPANDDYI